MKLKNLIPFRKSEEEKYFERIPYSMHNHEALTRKSDVAVVVPVYNAEKYLRQTVDSVIVQTFGFDRITLILVDDGSKDRSRHMMLRYAELYPNIVAIFLEENTGTPAFPRNLGAHLANSEYVMFLDADDWLEHDGIRQLHGLMEETRCDYAVGKTVQIDSKEEKIIGRYESCKERRNVSPYSIPHIFYHLGPRARMLRLSFIKKHNIRYPEMKFAEDKQFFIDVLTKVGKISTTVQPIYFLNRIPDNVSLTKQTDIVEKMDTNITVLKYVMQKNLPEEEEKMIVNRLVEFDSITRLFDRKHFIRSEDRTPYFEKFEEVMRVFYSFNRGYQLEDIMKKPINRLYFTYLAQKEYDKVIELSTWSKFNGERSYQLIEGLPYTVAHLGDGTDVKLEISAEATLISEKQSGNRVTLTVEMRGHRIPEIQGVDFQHRDHITDVYHVAGKVEQAGKIVTITMETGDVEMIGQGKYILTLRYDDYERLMVRKDSEAVCELKNNKNAYQFYRTVKGNLSFRVKESLKKS